MTPIRELFLQSLRRARMPKLWNIVVDPDPKRFFGIQLDDQPYDVHEFRIKLLSGAELEKFRFQNPSYSGATNNGSARPTKSITQTKWIRIVDSNQRNANGQTLCDVLIDIMDKFPSYELQSKQGAEVAIRDIESKLSDKVAASIEELKPQKRN